MHHPGSGRRGDLVKPALSRAEGAARRNTYQLIANLDAISAPS
jgi:hypothetical protein